MRIAFRELARAPWPVLQRLAKHLGLSSIPVHDTSRNRLQLVMAIYLNITEE